VFLKQLTLRGFKSFADKTVLDFEPGVSVVVGPNGSGKSNLVDAVAWVLGAQGPRTVRGSKMDDVIFAGTPERAALGRAEVSLSIDNTAGLLPIDFSEVTITRTLFRNGDSEYQINGAPCRLLDIQELLSDSGIGRQQHVIVSQGQLDTVLNARPEERRGVVEEAAGILKYRKRREKAERRLESTDGTLLRLNDLLREVRRGLGPLSRQADAARRHDGLAAELGAARLYLAGHELAGLQTRADRLRDRRAELQRQESSLRGRLASLDADVIEAESQLRDAGDTELSDALARAEALRERARGLSALVAEKHRGLERDLAAVADEGVVETLVADAVTLRGELAELGGPEAELARESDDLDAERRRLAAEEAALVAAAPAAASPGVAGTPDSAPDAVPGGGPGRPAGGPAERDDRPPLGADEARRELDARREALSRSVTDTERLRARLVRAREALEGVGEEQVTWRRRSAEADAGEERSSSDRSAADGALSSATADLDAADRRRRDADAHAHRWEARAEALAAALDAARSDAGAEALEGVTGVAGPLVDHLRIEPGAERAVAAALDAALGAVVVERSAVPVALGRLAGGDTAALLLVLDPPGAAGADATPDARPLPAVLPGARPLRRCVSADDPRMRRLVDRLLGPAVLVEGGWAEEVAALDALDAPVAELPPGPAPRVVVTRAGDRVGGSQPWRLGRGSASTVTAAALEEARGRAEGARADAEAAAARWDTAAAAVRAARARLDAAADAQRAGESERRACESALARLDARRAELEHDVEGLAAELEERSRRDRDDADRVAELEAELPRLEAEAREEAARAAELGIARAGLAARAAELAERVHDLSARRAAVEERRRVLSGRLAAVEDRLARHPERQRDAEARRAALLARAEAYSGVADRLDAVRREIGGLHGRLHERRRRRSEAIASVGRGLDSMRGDRADCERELTEARELAGRAEIDEAENRMRLEATVEKIRTEHDREPAAALDAPAPEVPEGTTVAGRARELERELRLMGPVNPLALEEYDALQERHEFLRAQLDDVKSTRRELSRVIRAVDAEIEGNFAAAFADAQAHFDALFATLFPGGSGRMFLTDPDDLLGSGIEIEARPSGKNTRRLSLLSGGERSLVALAFLFAVFRARPSPFYLLDEVEAALDDVNLHRFLDLLQEFRGEAQLLVVSHQKRTMEAADCLYGVSMPPGGSSRVVSQRMEPELVLDG